MRSLTQQEVAAAWLYHNKYAAKGIGAIDFYNSLSGFERHRVDEMIRDILSAPVSRDQVDDHPQSGWARANMGTEPVNQKVFVSVPEPTAMLVQL